MLINSNDSICHGGCPSLLRICTESESQLETQFFHLLFGMEDNGCHSIGQRVTAPQPHCNTVSMQQ